MWNGPQVPQHLWGIFDGGIRATQYPNAINPQVFYNQVVEEFVKSHKIQN